MSNHNLNSLVSFERRSLPSESKPNWSHSEKTLSKVKVQNSGRMEIDGKNYSVVDFANKFIGGGVLGSGCVQEEILFLLCPELLASLLFMESMDDNEAILITGHSVFNSNQDSYSRQFKWSGDYVDNNETDELGRKYRQIIAIDAINFKNMEDHEQFEKHCIQRELDKAYIGFLGLDEFGDKQPSIATGKWGCGAFKGDPGLKYFIQLLAASEAQRNLIFYTFNDRELAQNIKNFNNLITDKEVTVKQLYHLICDFRNQDYPDIFHFISDNM